MIIKIYCIHWEVIPVQNFKLINSCSPWDNENFTLPLFGLRLPIVNVHSKG